MRITADDAWISQDDINWQLPLARYSPDWKKLGHFNELQGTLGNLSPSTWQRVEQEASHQIRMMLAHTERPASVKLFWWLKRFELPTLRSAWKVKLWTQLWRTEFNAWFSRVERSAAKENFKKPRIAAVSALYRILVRPQLSEADFWYLSRHAPSEREAAIAWQWHQLRGLKFSDEEWDSFWGFGPYDLHWGYLPFTIVMAGGVVVMFVFLLACLAFFLDWLLPGSWL